MTTMFLGLARGQPAPLYLYLGVTLVTLLIVYQFWTSYSDLLTHIKATTLNYASVIQTRLDATLCRAEASVLTLAGRLPEASMGTSSNPLYELEINLVMNTQMLRFPQLQGLRTFNAAGDMIYTLDNKLKPRINVADSDFFRKLRDSTNNPMLYSNVIASRITLSRYNMALGRAIHSKQGAFIGAVTASINIEYMEQLFKSLHLGSLGIVAVYMKDTFQLVSRIPRHANRVNLPLAEKANLRKEIASGNRSGTLQFIATLDRAYRTYAYHALQNHPFIVQVGIAHDDAFREWRIRILSIGLITTLILVAFVIAAIGLLRLHGMLLRSKQNVHTLNLELEKQIEVRTRELRDSHHRFAFVLSVSPATIFESPDTAPFSPTFISDNLIQLLGYRAEEFQDAGDFWLTRIHPDDRHELLNQQWGADDRTYIHNFYRIQRKNGEWRHVSEERRVVRNPHHGHSVHVGALIDMTMRVSNEQIIRQTRETEGELLWRLVDALESERKRIAADLHDAVGQYLSTLEITIQRLRANSQSGVITDSLSHMTDLVHSATRSLREAINDLRPDTLEDCGVFTAIEHHVARFEQTTQLPVSLVFNQVDTRPPRVVELTIYRVIEECLTNVLKHSKASQVQIVISQDHSFYRVDIQDNGTGLPGQLPEAHTRNGGWGIAFMRERAKSVDGSLHIESSTAGTRITLEIPRAN